MKGHKDVVIMDLTRYLFFITIYIGGSSSKKLSIAERPDAILNIVDGTNIERNLYLSTQLLELGIPVIMAVNMMDIVQKNGDEDQHR